MLATMFWIFKNYVRNILELDPISGKKGHVRLIVEHEISVCLYFNLFWEISTTKKYLIEPHHVEKNF